MTSEDQTPAISVGKHLGPPPGEFAPLIQIGQPLPWPNAPFVGCVVRIRGHEDMVAAGPTAAEAVTNAIRTVNDVLEHRPNWLE
ncbi:hypothetical protein ACQP1O_20210 [Nocardia sp. CA-151230]|uniref:hypothetical protein n=1 Tax=Nocardia sp. CA-151230 TaxID=3239982 RepID=UPI003D8CAB79